MSVHMSYVNYKPSMVPFINQLMHSIDTVVDVKICVV